MKRVFYEVRTRGYMPFVFESVALARAWLEKDWLRGLPVELIRVTTEDVPLTKRKAKK